MKFIDKNAIRFVSQLSDDERTSAEDRWELRERGPRDYQRSQYFNGALLDQWRQCPECRAIDDSLSWDEVHRRWLKDAQRGWRELRRIERLLSTIDGDF